MKNEHIFRKHHRFGLMTFIFVHLYAESGSCTIVSFTYPTVIIVITQYHIASGILWNLVSAVFLSRKYITLANRIFAKPNAKNKKPRSVNAFFNLLIICLICFECLDNLKILNTRRTRSTTNALALSAADRFEMFQKNLIAKCT